MLTAEQIETLPIGIHPVIKSTSANSKFNDKGYVDASNYRILYGNWETFIGSEEKQGHTGMLGYGSIFESLTKTIGAIGSLTVKDNRYAKGSVDSFEIFDKSIAESIGNSVCLRTLGSKTETEKDQFISKHLLQESIDKAHVIINGVFGVIETSEELYVDPEEPDIKFLNITVTPNNVSEGDIDSLLDQFDKLQDQFLDETDVKYSSKITFHLDVA